MTGKLTAFFAGMGLVFSIGLGCDTRNRGKVTTEDSRPELGFTVPENNSTGVALQEGISIEFNRAMAPSTVVVRTEPPVSLRNREWSSGDKIVETGPVTAWAADTIYKVYVSGQDVNGKSLADDTFFQFTTLSESAACSSCDSNRSNNCDNGVCRCGTGSQCAVNESCAKPAGFDAFQCFPSCAQPGTTLQSCGNSCLACDTFLADTCLNGQCSCGNQGLCQEGQRCSLGQCVCDTDSCSNLTKKGCCQGNTCIEASEQTVNQCRSNTTSQCQNFTQPYVRADKCEAGQARCGSNDACNTNSVCVNGMCLAACSNSNCNGCCENGLCYTFDGFSSQGRKTSPQRCGVNGEACKATYQNGADTCTFDGKLVCGSSPTACIASALGYCDNGSCQCQPGVTQCGSGSVVGCCVSGSWCNVCDEDQNGSCDSENRTGQACSGTGGFISGYQVP